MLHLDTLFHLVKKRTCTHASTNTQTQPFINIHVLLQGFQNSYLKGISTVHAPFIWIALTQTKIFTCRHLGDHFFVVMSSRFIPDPSLKSIGA